MMTNPTPNYQKKQKATIQQKSTMQRNQKAREGRMLGTLFCFFLAIQPAIQTIFSLTTSLSRSLSLSLTKRTHTHTLSLSL